MALLAYRRGVVDMSGIFISYRREDGAEEAHRLYQALTARFGAGSVFIDVQSIELGENFAEVLDEKVGFCDALIAVIGKRWLASAHADGRRRLDDPEDWVRLEIVSALNRDIKVIPVLVGGATLPERQALPAPLALLVEAQALELRLDHFDEGVARLAAALETVRKGTTAVSLWFAMITRRHKALDPLDLHRPQILWQALRFMLVMVFIEGLLHLPAAGVADRAYSSKLWYLAHYTTAAYVEYLGAGFILHFAMKLFGGKAKLQRSIGAFCFLTAFVPLIAIAQIPVWGLNISVLKDAAEASWSPAEAVVQMQAFVAALGPFGVARLLIAFAAATCLWLLFLTAVFESLRTLHRLSLGRALVAFGSGLIITVAFLAFVVAPQFGTLYRLIAP
jgi:hypothetical protein